MKKITIILVILVVAVIIFFVFFKNTMKKELNVQYGPYACGNSELTVNQKARVNKVAGIIINDEVGFSFKSHTFKILKYPTHTSVEGSLTQETFYSEEEKREYVDSITSGEVLLPYDNGATAEQLISTEYVSSEELSDFADCYKANIGKVLIDKANKEAELAGSYIKPSRFNFDRVYSVK